MQISNAERDHLDSIRATHRTIARQLPERVGFEPVGGDLEFQEGLADEQVSASTHGQVATAASE